MFNPFLQLPGDHPELDWTSTVAYGAGTNAEVTFDECFDGPEEIEVYLPLVVAPQGSLEKPLDVPSSFKNFKRKWKTVGILGLSRGKVS